MAQQYVFNVLPSNKKRVKEAEERRGGEVRDTEEGRGGQGGRGETKNHERSSSASTFFSTLILLYCDIFMQEAGYEI